MLQQREPQHFCGDWGLECVLRGPEDVTSHVDSDQIGEATGDGVVVRSIEVFIVEDLMD
jgi:hypothetical protein